MHKFICKTVKGEISPLQFNKKRLLQKVLDSYEAQNKSYVITIEVSEANINEQQIKLYRAFIINATKEFGNTYSEMENILKRFHPINVNSVSKEYKDVSLWTTSELDSFINQSTALLAEFGLKF